MEKLKSRLPGIRVVILLTVVVLLGACARPPSTTVREGGDPFHVDKDVAFRTTYYFRVFDYCVARKLKNRKFDEIVVPLADSLYRFRMTGKSATLLSNIKFESGILKAWEVDPFGAKVEFDSNTNRFRVISPQEADADARRAAIKRDIEEMIVMYKRLKKITNNKPADTESKKILPPGILGKMVSAIQRKIEELSSISSGPTDDGLAAGQSDIRAPLSNKQKSAILKEAVETVLTAALKDDRELSQEKIQAIVNDGYNASTLSDADLARPGFIERAVKQTFSNAQNIIMAMIPQNTIEIQKRLAGISALLKLTEDDVSAKFARGQPPPSIHCPEDAPVRRGFQVLGPEGWRTFDPDERLIMAMSSSTAPLVSTLKELSNRVLNARDNPAAELLPIAQEQKRMAQTERDLDKQRRIEQPPEKLAWAICARLIEDESKKTEICGEEPNNSTAQ